MISQITCNTNLQLLIKLENGKPSCVKANHVERLILQGWLEQNNVIFGCSTGTQSAQISAETGFLMITSAGGYKEYVLKPNSRAYVTIVHNICNIYNPINESKYFIDYHDIFNQDKDYVNKKSLAKFMSPDNDTALTFLPLDKSKWFHLNLINVTKINDHTITETLVIKIDSTASLGLYIMPVGKCPPALLTIGDSSYTGHAAIFDYHRYNCPPGSDMR